MHRSISCSRLLGTVPRELTFCVRPLQLNALLSSAPEGDHGPVAPTKSLDSAMDNAAFDYDEFLTSFGGQSALSSYDPTASF